VGAQLGLIQGLPLAAGAQDRADGVGAGAIRDARPPAAEPMPVDVGRQQRPQDGPQVVTDPKARRRAVIRRPRALAGLAFLLIHAPHSTAAGLFG